MNILVYIQLNEGKVCDFSYDLISYAKEISKTGKVSGAVVLPEGENADINYPLLRKYGADKLYIIKSKKPSYDKTSHPFLITELIKQNPFEIFILTSTTEGREIAPIVSSSLETGLTADCTKLEIKDGKLISTRPTFGGKLMASILCKKDPQMATVRKNTFKKKEFNFEGELEVEEVSFESAPSPFEILEFKKDENNEFTSLENARIILTGGMGLKNKENFDKLKVFAKKIGAVACGTRKAVDSGLIEREFQIGQTGSAVAPEIYVAFGVSGAIHHIVGMENSKKIIAINTDKNAPIFNYADFGIVDDAAGVLKFLEANFN